MVWRAPRVSPGEWGHYQSLYRPVRADCCPRLYTVFMAPADCDAIKLACRTGWVCLDWYFVVFRATEPARWPRVKTYNQPLERHKTQKRPRPFGCKGMVLKRCFWWATLPLKLANYRPFSTLQKRHFAGCRPCQIGASFSCPLFVFQAAFSCG